MEPNIPQETSAEPGANLTMPMLVGGAVLAALVLGALYFYQRPIDSNNSRIDTSTETWMPAPSNSDDAAAIQAELEATNMSEFEQRMNADADASSSGI